MSEFIHEYLGSIIVGLIVLAVVTLIIVKEVRDRRSGNCSCGGNCSECGACHEKRQDPSYK